MLGAFVSKKKLPVKSSVSVDVPSEISKIPDGTQPLVICNSTTSNTAIRGTSYFQGIKVYKNVLYKEETYLANVDKIFFEVSNNVIIFKTISNVKIELTFEFNFNLTRTIFANSNVSSLIVNAVVYFNNIPTSYELTHQFKGGIGNNMILSPTNPIIILDRKVVESDFIFIIFTGKYINNDNRVYNVIFNLVSSCITISRSI